MTEDQIRDLFREMRDEPVPAASLVRVRQGIAQRRVERRWWIWLVPALVIAGGLVMALLIRPLPSAPPPAPPLIAAVREPPPAPGFVPLKPSRSIAHHVGSPVQLRSHKGTVVRIETNDPSVVILLVGE